MSEGGSPLDTDLSYWSFSWKASISTSSVHYQRPPCLLTGPEMLYCDPKLSFPGIPSIFLEKEENRVNAHCISWHGTVVIRVVTANMYYRLVRYHALVCVVFHGLSH